MHTVNHAVIGVSIALVTKEPVIALPAAFLSHYLLDALPHYGIRGDEGYKLLFKHWQSYLMVAVDIVGLAILILLIQGQPWYVFGSVIAAVLPDGAWVYRYFVHERKGRKFKGNALTRFHNWIQWGERRWGIFLEIPFASLFLYGISRAI